MDLGDTLWQWTFDGNILQKNWSNFGVGDIIDWGFLEGERGLTFTFLSRFF